MSKSVERKLVVNDVLSSSWGYEQTNVDFYQVTKLVGKTMVEMKKIGSNREYDECMSGKCTPILNSFSEDSEVLRKRVICGGESVRITSFSMASKWDGRPEYFSTYA